MSVDVSVVINAHREGRLLHRSVRSALVAIERAVSVGITCELLVVGDNVDAATRDVANQASVRLFSITQNDLGVARNHGVNFAAGRYITFLDGDDIMLDTWIVNAMAMADARSVLHREFAIQFGNADNIVRLPNSDDINPGWLLTENLWVSSVFAHRSIFEAVPYKRAPEGFSFEDWAWNCDVLATGYKHRVVPGEALLIRKKPVAESLGQTNFAKHAVAIPSPLWHVPFVSRQALPIGEVDTVPAETAKAWARAHLIEPATWPHELKSLEPACRDHSDTYFRMLDAWGHPDVVIACNGIGRGGAELVTLMHAKAHIDAGRDVLIVTTGKDPGAWVRQLPKEFSGVAGARHMHVPSFTDSPAVQLALFQRLWVQRPLKIAFNNNCDMLWMLLCDNAAALCHATDVYVAAYCAERADDGHWFANGYTPFDRVHDHVAGAFTDSEWFRAEMLERYAFDPAKVIAMKLPVPRSTRARAERPSGEPLRVLWASRFCPQKQPELLYEIALKCALKRLPIEFEIWGEGELPVAFDLLPNCRLRGVFDGFDQLPPDRYDVFLYTSAYDGHAFVISQALAAGMGVIALDTPAMRERGVVTFKSATDAAALLAFAESLASPPLRGDIDGRTWDAFLRSLGERYLQPQRKAA